MFWSGHVGATAGCCPGAGCQSGVCALELACWSLRVTLQGAGTSTPLTTLIGAGTLQQHQQASKPAGQLQKSAAAGLCKIHYKFLFLDVFWGAGKLETDRYAVPQYPGESETFKEHEERVWDLWYGLGWTKINCTLQHQFASQLTYLDPHGNLCES